MQIRILAILVFLSFILLSGCAKNYEPSSTEDLYVIEDFTASGQDDWELFTDQVMGGVSTGDVDFVIDGKKTLHMTGDVSLENNGGFILTRKNLKTNEGYFNASGFDGVWIKAKGNGKNYSVHIRTSANLFPWQFYQADFVAENITKTHFLPFADFTNYGTKTSMKLTKLKFISIAAAFEKMQADLYVEKIGFYKENAMFNKLTDEEKRVIIDKGTEKPFTGEYFEHYEKGIYVCRRCGAALYHSTSKFKSNCGWPSYDEAIDGAVTETPDADGRRTEITCTNCGGHLGHVFRGEGYTDKDTRHCVNSISMEFIPESRIEKAIVASGCFWGVQHQLSKIAGVLDSNAGYTGGYVENPTYKQVCTGTTGHAEAVMVEFDKTKTDYETILKLYFETHDPTQIGGQGPDIGDQYRSEIFYFTDEQKTTAEKLIAALKAKGFDVVTKLTPATKFWVAEDYHQRYYDKNGKTPYCHIYQKKF